MLTFIHQYVAYYQLALKHLSARTFTMLFTTLRGLGKITCQTFKPLNHSFRQNTHFQNGAPFIFDKYPLQTLQC